MRQQVLCHCDFLEPGSVGASTFGHPSLVVFFSSVIEEQMVLSMLGSLCQASLIQVVFFLNALHGVTRASVVDTRRCCKRNEQTFDT